MENRSVDLIQTKIKHKWRSSGCGYDPADYCEHCGANNYQSYGTEYCEDYRAEVIVRDLKAKRAHPPTEAAWAKLRSILSKEEWALLELREKHGREYRDKDRIVV